MPMLQGSVRWTLAVVWLLVAVTRAACEVRVRDSHSWTDADVAAADDVDSEFDDLLVDRRSLNALPSSQDGNQAKRKCAENYNK